MNGFSDFWVKKFPAGVMVGFTYKKKRFCHSRKLLKKVLKKSENCPDSYLDLRKARCGFTTQSKEVVPLGVNKNIRTVTNVISR